ncbi:helix-turn-helix transcriptional regulator [Halorussus salinisoli]|uniref:helix-turn-helix transcriptional regulator n=1 Tax=Halorussus salinisoli TaxID=2558242 RepID=UPI0010C2472D|nr:MarR family transcriptional regulator [Halorussus salinisoli]
MNQRRADAVVGFLVAAVLIFGGALSWQAYQQTRALNGMMGSMMGTSMGSVHGPNPFWYILGTLLVSTVIAGIYLAVRDDISTTDGGIEPRTDAPNTLESDSVDLSDMDAEPSESVTTEEDAQTRTLDILPEDERRVLEPVLTSPGITQIELRDRSDFSKSKVSQTVSALEKRGLLYRERQGRTYRIYPSDEIHQNHV